MKRKEGNPIELKRWIPKDFWEDESAVETLLSGLREGRDLRATCESVGIAKPAYDKALKEGYRALLVPYGERTPAEASLAEFYCKAKEATMEFERDCVGTILKSASMGDWKAAAWLLERRLPEIYGKRELPPLEPEAKEPPSIKIELVDPGTDSDRVASLERDVLNELDGRKLD